jgi:hypothetical protein
MGSSDSLWNKIGLRRRRKSKTIKRKTLSTSSDGKKDSIIVDIDHDGIPKLKTAGGKSRRRYKRTSRRRM